MTTQKWLSLAQAAKILGVHASTLRRWSDEGRIASIRTEGGHRRFDETVVEQYMLAQQLETYQALLPSVKSDPTPTWQEVFQGERLETMRQSGQRLLGLMLQYLTNAGEGERFLLDVRKIGQTYGDGVFQADLPMLCVVEAFTYYRAHFTEMAISLPGLPYRSTHNSEGPPLHERIDIFMNEVLEGAIEGFYTSQQAKPEAL